MFKFYMNMWVMKRVSESQLNVAFSKGYITGQELATILTTPQV